MGVRPERRNAAIRLAKGLQAFEHSLGVMQDRGPGVERKRGVCGQLSVVPPALRVPEDPDHVLGEDPAETGVRQQPVTLRGRYAPLPAVDLEFEGRGAGAHAAPNTTFRRGWKEAEPCDPASREEGRGSWLERGCGWDR